MGGAGGALAGANELSLEEANAKVFDGRFAKDFIGRRAQKSYNNRYYKGTYQGVIKRFEVKPNNVNKIVFWVFFEDGKWNKFHDGDPRLAQVEKCILP